MSGQENDPVGNTVPSRIPLNVSDGKTSLLKLDVQIKHPREEPDQNVECKETNITTPPTKVDSNYTNQ